MFQGRNAAWWIVPGAMLIACLYVPTLTTRFDFADDGNLVYAAPPGTSATEYYQRLCERIESNVRDLGPFRPVLWVHWELAANLLGDDAFAWRSLRLVWTALAAGTFLWLLSEFGLHPLACLGSTALAMWNPWRNEIWLSLTLGEGVAMPYAIFSLIAALRAGRSPRPWLWVFAACWAMLMALGCKNTFLVLIPVQLLLRVYPQADVSWRQSLRRSWVQLLALFLPLLMPGIHSALIVDGGKFGHYAVNGLTLGHLGQQLQSLSGAMSLEWIAAGLVLSAIALVLSAHAGTPNPSWKGDLGAAWGAVWDRQRLPCLTGSMLLVLGLAIYLPFKGVAGRYNIPAAWGVDLWVASLLSAVLSMPRTVWVRVAGTAFSAGLIAVAVANVGKQHKFATRAEMLWGVVEYLETHAESGDHIAWVTDANLSGDEGVHVMWHLHNRGRTDLQVSMIDTDGNLVRCAGVPAPTCAPMLWVSSGQVDSPPGSARRMADFRTYPIARKPHHCVLWHRKPAQRYVDAR